MTRSLPIFVMLLVACAKDAPESSPPAQEEPASEQTVFFGQMAASPQGIPRPTSACMGQPRVSWESWAEGFFRGYCTSCHSTDLEDRWGAPEGINFDTEADVVALKQQIQSSVLDSGRMPVGGGVIESDLELLQIYLSCGM